MNPAQPLRPNDGVPVEPAAPRPRLRRPIVRGRTSNWWRTFGLLTIAGAMWIVAMPPMTGPDEVYQARRAAAVARGEWAGSRHDDGPPLLLDVEVPRTYVDGGESAYCFVGPLVADAPQDQVIAPPPNCPPYVSDSSIAAAPTGQYRGQPTYYALVGAPTLLFTGVVGTYLMRLVGLLAAVALLTEAIEQSAASRRPAAARGLLLGCITPVVLYLAAVTNPIGVEIAAALLAWVAGSRLAGLDSDADPDSEAGRSSASRVVTGFAVGLLGLLVTRGLGPLFAFGLVATIALLAGRARTTALLRRPDVRRWSVAVILVGAASAAWLVWVQQAWVLPPRDGSGWTTAVGSLPWYLHQSVGVFGQNDSAIPMVLSVMWAAALLALCVALVRRTDGRARALSIAVLTAGVVLGVTADGLDLPPIGFFWQGRYALPVLVGGFVIAAMGARRTSEPRWWRTTERWVIPLGFVVVQVIAFAVEVRYHAEANGPSIGWLDAFTGPRWAPPVPSIVTMLVFTGSIAALYLARPADPAGP